MKRNTSNWSNFFHAFTSRGFDSVSWAFLYLLHRQGSFAGIYTLDVPLDSSAFGSNDGTQRQITPVINRAKTMTVVTVRCFEDVPERRITDSGGRSVRQCRSKLFRGVSEERPGCRTCMQWRQLGQRFSRGQWVCLAPVMNSCLQPVVASHVNYVVIRMTGITIQPTTLLYEQTAAVLRRDATCCWIVMFNRVSSFKY